LLRLFLEEKEKNMKHELFVEQPNLEMYIGVKVFKDTEISYKTEKVEQVLKDCVLETILNEEGTNGINSYTSKSYLKINLNPGDVLLFNKDRGYYMPPYPVTSIPDAINDIQSIEGMAEVEPELP
jgi:hypothetical protein